MASISVKKTRPVEELPLLSDISKGAVSVAIDLSWGMRNGIDFLPGCNDTFGIVADPATATPGISNIPSGIHNLALAHAQFKQASARGYTQGQIEAGMDIGRGLLQTATGIARAVNIPTSIAAAYRPNNPAFTSSALLSSNVLGGLFIPLFAADIPVGLYQMYQTRRFYSPLAKMQEEPNSEKNQFDYLVENALISSEEIDQIDIQKGFCSLKAKGKEQLELALGKTLSKRELYAQFEVGYGRYQLEALLKEHFSAYPELITLASLYGNKIPRHFNFTETLGFLFELRRMQANKDARMTASVGAGTLKKIKNAAIKGLKARAQSENPVISRLALKERAQLLSEVKLNHITAQRQQCMNILLSVIGTFSCILGVMSIAMLGAAGVYISLILSFALPAIYLYLDSKALFASLEGTPGKHDKKLLLFLLIPVLLGVITSITTFLFLGGSPEILGLSLALSFGKCAICLYVILQLKKTEKKYSKEHPTIEDLCKRLKKEKEKNPNAPLSSKALQQFKKLPKALRQEITDASVRKYKLIEIQQFSQEFLERYFNKATNAIESEQLRRAIKKTAKTLWIQGYNNAYYRAEALKVEQLLQLVLEDKREQAQHAFKAIISESTRQQVFKKIFRILKREESATNMLASIL